MLSLTVKATLLPLNTGRGGVLGMPFAVQFHANQSATAGETFMIYTYIYRYTHYTYI